ncbi:MAG TPA: hypothetical protein VFL76_03815 [Edaphocola sp.]|nr:hypothetical protein [Edaphocola sp.]
MEEESLINNASALIAYHFAVAAVTGITFVPVSIFRNGNGECDTNTWVNEAYR